MKEQTRNTEVQIDEEEIGKLLEKEFRIMIVKMIKNLELPCGIEYRTTRPSNHTFQTISDLPRRKYGVLQGQPVNRTGSILFHAV